MRKICLLLSLALLFSMAIFALDGPEIFASSNMPSTLTVEILCEDANGDSSNQVLNYQYPYLVNGVRSATGDIENDPNCTAKFSKGVLEIKNLDVKRILVPRELGWGSILTLKLGIYVHPNTNNRIKLRNYYGRCITNESGGDIQIYLDENSKLELDLSQEFETDSSIMKAGISTYNYSLDEKNFGGVEISGPGSLEIFKWRDTNPAPVPEPRTYNYYGIYANENGITIKDGTNVHIDFSDNSRVRSQTGFACLRNGALTLDNAGDVLIELNTHEENPSPSRGIVADETYILNNSKKLNIVYRIKNNIFKTFFNPIKGYKDSDSWELHYDESKFAYNEGDEFLSIRRGKPYLVKTRDQAGYLNISGIDWISNITEVQALEGEQVHITPRTDIPYVTINGWRVSDVYGVTAPQDLEYIQPRKDTELIADYSSWLYHGSTTFTKIPGENAGKISFNIYYEGQGKLSGALEKKQGNGSWEPVYPLFNISNQTNTYEIDSDECEDGTYRINIILPTNPEGFKEHKSEEFLINFSTSDLLTGQVTLIPRPAEYGKTISIGGNSLPANAQNLAYKWYCNGELVQNGGTSYTPIADDVYKGLSVQVTASNYVGYVESDPIIVQRAKNPRDDLYAYPHPDEVMNISYDSIDFRAAGDSPDELEYAIREEGNEDEWQWASSVEVGERRYWIYYTHLKPATDYNIGMRFKGTQIYEPSDAIYFTHRTLSKCLVYYGSSLEKVLPYDDEAIPNDRVLTLEAPPMWEGQVFEKWTSSSSGVVIDSPTSSTTRVQMPAYNNVIIKAQYKDIPAGESVNVNVNVLSWKETNSLVVLYEDKYDEETIKSDIKDGTPVRWAYIATPGEVIKDGDKYKQKYAFTNIAKGNYIVAVYKNDSLIKLVPDIVALTNVNVPDIDQWLKGDVNGNGEVNANDLQRLYTHLNGTNSLTGDALEVADVNSNGEVNANDLQRLYTHLNGTNLLY